MTMRRVKLVCSALMLLASHGAYRQLSAAAGGEPFGGQRIYHCRSGQ